MLVCYAAGSYIEDLKKWSFHMKFIKGAFNEFHKIHIE